MYIYTYIHIYIYVELCGGAVNVARVGEQAGGAPEELDAGALLLGLEHLGHGVEILVRDG